MKIIGNTNLNQGVNQNIQPNTHSFFNKIKTSVVSVFQKVSNSFMDLRAKSLKDTQPKLEKLGIDLNSDIEDKLRAAEYSKNTATLDILSSDPNPEVRAKVAVNRNTADATVVKLSRDKEYKVVNWLAQRQTLPAAARENLMELGDTNITDLITHRENLPYEPSRFAR